MQSSHLCLPALLLLSSSGLTQVQFSEATVECGLLPDLNSGQTVSGMRAGLAVGDFNRDGYQDIYVLGNNLRADALFMNNGDGTFTDRAPAWGVNVKHRGGGACVGDVDGDGWLDIYVTSEGGKPQPKVGQHILWHYENGRFVNRAKVAGVGRTSRVVPDGFGCAFGDYDLDGDLDLYATGWKTFPNGSNGNVLFRNEGNMKFKRVTRQANLGHLIGLPSFAPTFVDMNGDRYPELILASDFGTSRYLVNNGDGTFRDWTNHSNTSYETNGMGSTIGDFNNDGLIDWYVTSVDTSGGNGNKLYINEGAHHFREVAYLAGVGAGWWGWGTVAIDADLDGWQDLMETNGWNSATYGGKPSCLWLNNRDLTFTDAAAASGFDHKLNGLGMVNLDLDEDGDQDVVITACHYGHLRLYRNDQVTAHHWLRVSLDTSGSSGLAPDGYGSRIELTTNGQTQVRMMANGCKYLSTSELVAAFGVGDATSIDQVVVRWNDGTTKTLTNVSVDQHITVKSW